MNSLRKNYNYPKERPKGFNNNLQTKEGGWLHSSNQLLLDNVLDKIIQKNKVITIFEFGSYMGLSAVYMAKKLNKKCRIICVDHWEGGYTITKKMSNKEKNDLKNKLYYQFLTNTWEYRDMITPLKMDGREGMKYLYELGIEPDFIYLDMDHEFEPVYGDLKLLISLYPKTPIAGDDYAFHPGVREAVDELRPFIQQYKIYTYKNIYLLSPYQEFDFHINRLENIFYNIQDDIKTLVILHDNYRGIMDNKWKDKIIKDKNIIYYVLEELNFDGLLLNSVIDSIYKKYKINNIVFQDINNNYDENYKKYILSNYYNILFLDDYNDKFALTFMINYDLFKLNNGFDNILENDDIFTVFFYNILLNLDKIYKPMYKLIKGDVKYVMNRNSKIMYDITYKTSYLNIKYKIKSIKNTKNIININFENMEITLPYILEDINNNNFIYGIYPVEIEDNYYNDKRIDEIKMIDKPLKQFKTSELEKIIKVNNKDPIILLSFNYIKNIDKIKNVYIDYGKFQEESLSKFTFINKKYTINSLKEILPKSKIILDKINKKVNYDYIYYCNKFYDSKKKDLIHYLDNLNNIIDNNLNNEGYLTIYLGTYIGKHEKKELFEIFKKFEKIIILKPTNYYYLFNTFWILCYKKLDKKDYYKKYSERSFYEAMNKIKLYRENYKEIIRKFFNESEEEFYLNKSKLSNNNLEKRKMPIHNKNIFNKNNK